MKPLLPKRYRVRVGLPGEDGDETLVLTSAGRRVTLAGRSFEAFLERVVPLLDGTRTLEEIQRQTADVFDPSELEASLAMLERHRILEDGEHVTMPYGLDERIEPQLGYLREVSADPDAVLERLAEARVTVVGLGAVGAVAATALASAAVGHVRLVDGSIVSTADPVLAQVFELGDIGRNRAIAARDRIAAVNPVTAVEVLTEELHTDRDLAAAIDGSDFVLGCLDPGLVRTTYKLNRACLAQGVSWSSAVASAFEGVVGPTVIPHETACYLCYRLRAAACAEDPREALAELKHEDENSADRSEHRENLPFGAGIVGNLLALEAFKAVAGIRPPTAGRVLTVDFATCTTRQHLVLRRPACPACFRPVDA